MGRSIGTEDLVGATIVWVDGYSLYDGAVVIRCSKEGAEFRMVVEKDWGYCYCEESCSCEPTYNLRVEAL